MPQEVHNFRVHQIGSLLPSGETGCEPFHNRGLYLPATLNWAGGTLTLQVCVDAGFDSFIDGELV